MRGLKPIALLGIGSIAAAESSSACNSPSSPSTIYLTVPGSPVTETVYAVTSGPSPVVGVGASVNAITTTVASSFVSTQLVNVIQATSGVGSYSFTEENGTTSWLGNTPPDTALLVTTTSIVTLQPVLTTSPAVSEGPSSQSTTDLTLYSTETITETSTMTVTESYSTVSSSAGAARAYTGLKSSGWNATMTTLTKVKATATGSVISKPSSYQPALKAEVKGAVVGNEVVKPSPYLRALKAKVEEKPASFSGTAYALTTSSGNKTNLVQARQGPDIVFATIDGVVVSWTNNWVPSPPTPVVEPSVTPIATTIPPADPGASSPLETATSLPITTTALPPVQTIATSILASSLVALASQTHVWVEGTATASWYGPTSVGIATTIGVYPWDTSPAVSTSTTDVTLSLVSQSSILLSESPTMRSAAASTSTAVPSISNQATSAFRWTNTSSATGSAATSTASACGNCCENTPVFTIDFDDLPHFSIGNDPAESDIPPIFNPYRKLYFQDHFGYVPPPSDPFPPHSAPQLAMYRVAGINVTGSPDAGLLQFGEIGSGPNHLDSSYFFDANSVWFGCANSGPGNCTVTINGFVLGADAPVVSIVVTQPPCPGLKNCSLRLIEFDTEIAVSPKAGHGFHGLNGLQFIAAVGDQEVDYYMDDLMLAWSNNTCAAQQERSSSE